MKPRTLFLPAFLSALMAAALTGQQGSAGTFPVSAVSTRDGKYLLVLHGGSPSPAISVMDLASAKELSRTPVPEGWLGLALSRTGDRVYAGGGSRAAIYEFSFAAGILKPARVFPIVAEKARTREDFIGDVQFSPDGRLLYAADLFRDSVVVVNPQSGLLISRIKTGRRPYRILFHPSGKSFYVSSWADGSVSQYETATGNRMAVVRLAPGTMDMVWRTGEVEDRPELKARLFVAAANTNNVYALGATETGDLSRLETISVALAPGMPAGMTPSALGLSVDGNRLYVACSDMNVVAVVDISGARSRVTRFIPTAPYPLAVVGLADGKLAALSLGGVPLGGVQIMDGGDVPPDNTAVPAWAPGLTAVPPASIPLRHVVYIVNGTLEADAGNTPNRRKLAEEFVRLDNFQMNGASLTAGVTSPYIRRLGNAGLPETDPAAAPPAGYLWTNAAQAGIRLANFGFFVDNLPKADADGTRIASVHDPVLLQNTDGSFPGRDANYPDTVRAQAFISALKDFEKAGSLPPLLLLRLGNEQPTPAMVTDNDEALGMIVETISKSRFWNDTAIFIVPESTADAEGHAPAWVISPGVKHQTISKTLYNQSSFLRTVEMILGLHPMTTADASAAPLFEVFSGTADVTPFASVKRP